MAPGVLAIPVAAADDPNRDVFADARERARDFGVDVVAVPSPGRIERDGAIVPASHMNFSVANSVVVVPTHGAASVDAAVAAIGALFPRCDCTGLRADHILTDGGSFHCITQQQPT